MSLAYPPKNWVAQRFIALYTWLKSLTDLVNQFAGGLPALLVDAVITAPLPASTYANGTLGVGATLTANANGAFGTQDGVAAVLNNIYLVTGQASHLQNGLYKLTQVGTGGTPAILTRVTGYDTSAEMQQGTFIGVKSGTLYAGTTWKQTSAGSPTVGTDVIDFAEQPGQVTTNTAQTITGQKTLGASLIYSATAVRIADPGGANAAIPVTQSGYIPIVTAGAETNTLAIPTFDGQELTLCMDTRVGGDRVITSAQAIDQAGNTVMTFGAARDMIKLGAITVGGARRWQVLVNEGVALS